MFKKVTSLGMVAATAILFGMTACGSKTSASGQNDTLSGDTVFATDTAAEIINDSNIVLDSALAQAADSINADAKPGKDGYITTPSGLKYKVIRKGSGRRPMATDVVKVDYEGKLVNGTVFDSSYQ